MSLSRLFSIPQILLCLFGELTATILVDQLHLNNLIVRVRVAFPLDLEREE